MLANSAFLTATSCRQLSSHPHIWGCLFPFLRSSQKPALTPQMLAKGLLNHERALIFCNLRPAHDANLFLTCSAYSVKSNMIKLRFNPLPDFLLKLFLLICRYQTLKNTILHWCSITQQEFMHPISSFIIGDVVNHKIKSVFTHIHFHW